MCKLISNHKVVFSLFVFFSILPIGGLLFGQQEDITITSYTPSPYASYDALRTTRISVGAGYNANVIPANGVIVEGQVGIGVDPINMLDVSGAWALGGAGYSNVGGPANGLSVQGAVGIGTNVPVNAVLDIRGATNICVRRTYPIVAPFIPTCPAGYDFAVPQNQLMAAIPAPTFFLCCRICQDGTLDGLGNVVTGPDGVCG